MVEIITLEDQRREHLQKAEQLKTYINKLNYRIDLVKIKNERLKRGLTQEDLVKFLDLKNISDYSRKESGKTQFTIIELKKLALFYDHTNADIFIKQNTY